ncbi:MAG TPA: alkaline phosphatase family protein [Pirellulales bacterium]
MPRLFTCALILVSLVATSVRADAGPGHVVLISVDGFPAYLLWDQKLPIPNIRKLARQGAWAEGMRVSNPSVTWPNHTTLVTGVRPERHGVLFNGVLVHGAAGMPATIDPKRDQRDLIRVPTIFDVAHAAGLSTVGIDWPCTRNAPGLDENYPDVPDAGRYTTSGLRSQLLADGVLKSESEPTLVANSPIGHDDAWTTMACRAIVKQQPRLLLLHLLNVDATHHAEGPRSGPGYTAVAYADALVGRVLAAIDEAGIRDRTTIFVVADHGFTSTPKGLKPNALLRKHGLLTAGRGGKPESADVMVVPEGGIGMLYFTRPQPSAADFEQVKAIFKGQEGLVTILEPADYSRYGFPQPTDNPQMADLVLVAKDGYSFSGNAEGDDFVVPGIMAKVPAGNHGFISTEPKMNALCVISGHGIKAGIQLPVIENIDIAPTVAALLKLQLPNVQGRVLKEALAGE